MLFITLTLITAALFGAGQAAPSTAVNLARDDKNPNLTHIICKPNTFREARKDFTMQNADYVRSKDSRGPLHLAHTLCTRVACQYASAIYVCNDNGHDVDLPFGTLADYAQAVVDDEREECNWLAKNYEGGTDDEHVTSGQAFDANGWNVIVGIWHSDEKC